MGVVCGSPAGAGGRAAAAVAGRRQICAQNCSMFERTFRHGAQMEYWLSKMMLGNPVGEVAVTFSVLIQWLQPFRCLDDENAGGSACCCWDG